MDLVSSKFFTSPLIFGFIVHNGLTFLSSLNKIKYLKRSLFNKTLLRINILSISTYFMSIGYLE